MMRKMKVLLEFTEEEVRCTPLDGSFSLGKVIRRERGGLQLKSFLADHFPGRKISAYVLIPFDQGYMRLFSLPWMEKRDRKSAIHHLIEEEIPLPPDNRITDSYLYREERKKSLQIVIGAVKKNTAFQYITLLQQAGIKILGLDFSLAALGRGFARSHIPTILYITDHAVVFFHYGIPEMIKYFSFDDQASWVKKMEAELRKALVRYGFDRYERPLCLLSYDHPSLVELKDKLTSGGLCAGWDEESLSGLNLRDFSGPGLSLYFHGRELKEKGQHFNFYSAILQIEKAENRKLEQGLLIGTGAVLAICGFLAWYIPATDMEKINSQVRALEEKGKALQGQNLPERKIGKQLTKLLGISQVTVEEIYWGEQGLMVQGKSLSAEAVYEAMQELRKQGWQTVILEEYRQEGMGRIDFSVSAKM